MSTKSDSEAHVSPARLSGGEGRLGKGGGLALQRPPEQICIGDVVRSMEKHFNWVECFDPEQQSCRLLPGCGLKHLLAQAGNAYLQVLDATTLADVLLNTRPLELPMNDIPIKLIRTVDN